MILNFSSYDNLYEWLALQKKDIITNQRKNEVASSSGTMRPRECSSFFPFVNLSWVISMLLQLLLLLHSQLNQDHIFLSSLLASAAAYSFSSAAIISKPLLLLPWRKIRIMLLLLLLLAWPRSVCVCMHTYIRTYMLEEAQCSICM